MIYLKITRALTITFTLACIFAFCIGYIVGTFNAPKPTCLSWRDHVYIQNAVAYAAYHRRHCNDI